MYCSQDTLTAAYVNTESFIDSLHLRYYHALQEEPFIRGGKAFHADQQVYKQGNSHNHTKR